MAKRFVDSVVLIPSTEITAGLEVAVRPEWVRIMDSEGDMVCITPSQWEQIISLVNLEDVPEPKSPGQRLWEGMCPSVPWGEVVEPTRGWYEQLAAELGIQPL